MKLTMKTLKNLIREELNKEAIILEAFGKKFTCDKYGHTNGFILPDGVYVDLSESQYMSHVEWIGDNMDILSSFEDKGSPAEDKEDDEGWEDSDLPKNLISVSNPAFWAIQHSDWSVATDAQIHGMIDCLLSCRNYVSWLNNPNPENNIETKQITFYHNGENGMKNKMSFPDFLERFGNESHMERLFSNLTDMSK